jgi:hypothetical protein
MRVKILKTTLFVRIGQGTGYFPYPKASFMISQIDWAYRGAGLAGVGLIVIMISRKL